MTKLLGSIFIIFISVNVMAAGKDGYALIAGMQKYSLEANNGSGTSSSQFSPLFGLGYFKSIFEIDFLYTQKNLGGGSAINTSLLVPAFVRAELDSSLNLGLGAYVDLAMAKPSMSDSKSVDYGMGLSAQFTPGSLFLEFRYLYGLADLPLYSRNIQFLFGIHF